MERDFDKFINETEKKVEKQEEKKETKALTPKQVVANSIVEKNISDSILNSFDKLMQQGQLTFPKEYPLGNELKLAFYKIQSAGYVNSATPMSIGNAISEMAIQGLSIGKNQGYFIKYGNEVSFQRSYFGDIALAKRTGLIVDVYANVIYDGDEIVTGFDEFGRETVIEHKTSFANKDNAIKGAYAVAVGINGKKMYAIMTKKQIDANWSLSKDSTHKFQTKFPEEASKRTAIRRLLKMVFNTAEGVTEEQSNVIELYNRGVEEEYQDNTKETKYNSTSLINEHVINVESEEIANPFGEAGFDD